MGYGVAHSRVSASTITATGRSGVVSCQMPATASTTIMIANHRRSMRTPYRSQSAAHVNVLEPKTFFLVKAIAQVNVRR